MQSKQTMNELMDKIWAHRGAFVSTGTGDEVNRPEDGFVVVAGPWPNPFLGARQVRCSSCTGFAGLSQRGWELHREDPERRPIVCPICLVTMIQLEKAMEARRATKCN